MTVDLQELVAQLRELAGNVETADKHLRSLGRADGDYHRSRQEKEKWLIT